MPVAVRIKAGKYGGAIGLLLERGGAFQTRHERTLIVDAGQKKALEQAGLTDTIRPKQMANEEHGQKKNAGGRARRLALTTFGAARRPEQRHYGRPSLSISREPQGADHDRCAQQFKKSRRTPRDYYLQLCVAGKLPSPDCNCTRANPGVPECAGPCERGHRTDQGSRRIHGHPVRRRARRRSADRDDHRPQGTPVGRRELCLSALAGRPDRTRTAS